MKNDKLTGYVKFDYFSRYLTIFACFFVLAMLKSTGSIIAGVSLLGVLLFFNVFYRFMIPHFESTWIFFGAKLFDTSILSLAIYIYRDVGMVRHFLYSLYLVILIKVALLLDLKKMSAAFAAIMVSFSVVHGLSTEKFIFMDFEYIEKILFIGLIFTALQFLIVLIRKTQKETHRANVELVNRNHELKALSHIVQSVGSTLDFPKVIKRISHGALDVAKAEHAVLFIVDRENKRVSAMYETHKLINDLPMKQKGCLLDSQAPEAIMRLVDGEEDRYYYYYSPDMFTDPQLAGTHFGSRVHDNEEREVIFLALKGKRRVVGILMLDNVFSRRKLNSTPGEALRNFQALAGAVIENSNIYAAVREYNAKLYQQSEEWGKQLRRKIVYMHDIFRISEEMKVILEPENLEHAFLHTLIGTARCTRAMLMRKDKAGNFVSHITRGEMNSEKKSFRFKESSPFISMTRMLNKPVMVDKLFADSSIKSHDDMEIIEPYRMILPLLGAKGIERLILLGPRHNDESYSDEDVELLGILMNQFNIAFENANLYKNLKNNYHETIRAFATSIEAKDVYTRGHSDRVTNYVMAVAGFMALPAEQMDQLRITSLLHDIGKIGVPEHILNKPAKLTTEEYEVIKMHPVIGQSILEKVEFFRPMLANVRHHHERMDGRGYPDGLEGSQLPMEVRLLAIADAYDAMTTDRPYRKATGRKEAFGELERYSGTQFDSDLVKLFIKIIGENGDN